MSPAAHMHSPAVQLPVTGLWLPTRGLSEKSGEGGVSCPLSLLRTVVSSWFQQVLTCSVDQDSKGRQGLVSFPTQSVLGYTAGL